MDSNENVNVFSVHKIFTTWYTPVPIEFLVSSPGYAIGPCTLFIAYMKPRGTCVSLKLETGNTFLIFKYFQAKYLSYGAIIPRDVAFFCFFIKLSQVLAGYALCCTFFLRAWRDQWS